MDNSKLYDKLLELVKKRRSIRRFKADPIPDEYVDKIIEVARWAPSGFHTQPWEFVVIKNKDLKDRVTDAISGPVTVEQSVGQIIPSSRQYFRNAPVFIILLGDWRAKVGLPFPAEGNENTVDRFFTSSLAGAFLYLHLAAASLGLASAWVSASSSMDSQHKIKEILHIPESLTIYDMMAIGYGDYLPVPKVLRDKNDVIHYDDQNRYRTDAEVIADAQKTRAWCLSAH